MKNYNYFLFIALFSCISFSYNTCYGLTTYAASGGGFQINLISSNSIISETPILGSNGKNYYSVGPNAKGIEITEGSAISYGTVKCFGAYLAGDYWLGVPQEFAYHRLFAYMPNAGFNIEGQPAYRINKNTFFTLYAENGIASGWKKITARLCSNLQTGSYSASNFTVQFPFEIRFYVNELPLDGKIVIPGGVIAGYSRFFQDEGTPSLFIPEEQSTIKLDILPATIVYPTSCLSNISELNIEHHTLNSIEFDNVKTATVNYTCNPPIFNIPVKFTLDYVTDDDVLKRVPLKSGSNTIYSELSIYDEQSQQKGKTILTTISNVKNIKIESKLSGSDAEPGDYKGSAWLIATYL